MTFLLEIRPKTSFFAPTGETGGGSGQNRVVIGLFSSLNVLSWQPTPRITFEPQRKFGALANPNSGDIRAGRPSYGTPSRAGPRTGALALKAEGREMIPPPSHLPVHTHSLTHGRNIMTDKLGIILAALIVAAAIAFTFRWEFIVTSDKGYFRVDRWTGTLAMCLPYQGVKFVCAAEWQSAGEKVAPK
jgi:hypothetical protein